VPLEEIEWLAVFESCEACFRHVELQARLFRLSLAGNQTCTKLEPDFREAWAVIQDYKLRLGRMDVWR
jgi:hypothetical protein